MSIHLPTELRSDVWDEEDEQCRKNWFSASNAMRVYSSYLDLDCDRNGMLSRKVSACLSTAYSTYCIHLPTYRLPTAYLKEFSEYGMGTLTEVFVNRVFQVGD